jgi:hypothetical protein
MCLRPKNLVQGLTLERLFCNTKGAIDALSE